jgi:ankyrin repeat protein
MFGNLEIVKMSLNTNTSLEAEGYNGQTALMMAKAEGHNEIAQLLKAAGAKR